MKIRHRLPIPFDSNILSRDAPLQIDAILTQVASYVWRAGAQ